MARDEEEGGGLRCAVVLKRKKSLAPSSSVSEGGLHREAAASSVRVHGVDDRVVFAGERTHACDAGVVVFYWCTLLKQRR